LKASYSDLSGNKRPVPSFAPRGTKYLVPAMPNRLADWARTMEQIGQELRKVSPPESLPPRLRTLLARVERKCAQCGADLIAPEWSEHLPDHHVRNLWSCEACGYQFEDTIYLSARQFAAAD
jgi:rubrerythrin